MNNTNKKSSKKTSLFEPTYSGTILPQENLIIATPVVFDEKEKLNDKKITIKDTSFDLKKYYENLNNDPIELMNSSNLSKSLNFIGLDNNNQKNIVEHHNTSISQDLDKELTSSKTKNLGSYFTFNKITNYFNSKTEFNSEEKISSSNEEINFHTKDVSSPLMSPKIIDNFIQPNFYHPPKPHWFFKINTLVKSDSNEEKISDLESTKNLNECEVWLPFSFYDSDALEKAYSLLDQNQNICVPTNGNRYDCYVKDRILKSVYWSEKNLAVRRCTWFYKKEGHKTFIPYDEIFSNKLEELYYDVLVNNKWNQRIDINEHSQEMIIFYSSNSIMHYELNENLVKDEWNTLGDNPIGLRIVSRELTVEDLELYEVCLKDDEQLQVDNLVFFVHGVGAFCDIRFRSIKEVVDDFRKISLNLTRTHFRQNQQNQKLVGRTEFIPVYWHDALHGKETGIDARLKSISLSSVPKLRSFANDTVLDALFYTSPVYCQTIINAVTNEINKLYNLFIKRNPKFRGSVSLSGHSLGSVILFDILANQKEFKSNRIDSDLSYSKENPSFKKLNNSWVYNFETVNNGQETITYPKLNFKTDCFFALGSPISMFLTLRGISSIDQNFYLPNFVKVYNIFHPFDPIAYRIEPMINSDLKNVRPVVIPHHKGRKRMHIEIKENLVKMGSDIKEKVLFGIKSTWDSVNNLVGIPKPINTLETQQDDGSEFEILPNNFNYEKKEVPSSYPVGLLNNGERIDYVLQEKPIEFFNQYIFALATHACYWGSEDTCLFMLKELYKMKKIYPDQNINLYESTEFNSQTNLTETQNNQFSDSSSNFNSPLYNQNSQYFNQPINLTDQVSTSIEIE